MRLHVERTDGLHLVAEKVDTVGELVGERENVEDTASEGVLPRLIYIIDLLEAILVQHVGDKHIIQLLAHVDLQGIFLQYFPRHDSFRQGVRIRDDHERGVRVLQPAEYLGAQDLVRRIDMPVLDGPPVSGREEVYLIAGGKLHQVVIEIAGFLLVVQYTHIASPSFRKKRGDRHRRTRAIQSL